MKQANPFPFPPKKKTQLGKTINVLKSSQWQLTDNITSITITLSHLDAFMYLILIYFLNLLLLFKKNKIQEIMVCKRRLANLRVYSNY